MKELYGDAKRSKEKTPNNERSQNLFLVALSLFDGPKICSEILKDVFVLSNGGVNMIPNNFYVALNRYKEYGFVRPTGVERVDGREKEYELTDKGREMLEVEDQRFAHMIGVYDLLVSQPPRILLSPKKGGAKRGNEYRLTPLGREVLKAHTARLRNFREKYREAKKKKEELN